MFPNPLLQDIYETKQVTDGSGNRYQLHSAVDTEEGNLLHSLLIQHKFNTTLEIGCAFGISSLWICDAVSHQTLPHHTIIDPCQETDWHGVGVANLKKAGFHFFELIEKPSEIVLPSLLAEGRSFQFAFIDGWHTFDHTLLDFFYINRLLEDGGIVAIDDVDFPSIRKVSRYILNYPNYKLVAATTNLLPCRYSRKRRIVDAFLRSLSIVLPKSYREEVFADSWQRSDYSLGVDCSLVALQKTGPDTRSWNWHKPF